MEDVQRVAGVELDHRFCSGLGGVIFGSLKIRTKDADIVVAGGMENKTHNIGFHHKGNIPFRI